MSSTNEIHNTGKEDNHNVRSRDISSRKNSITSCSKTAGLLHVLGLLLGGDYAGQSATFSNVDGSLIRVPEQYVPESLIEWGQIPSCLEVIVSEDWKKKEEGEEEDCDDCLTRTTVTVLPEVGCGIDNLETLKKKEEIPLDCYKTFAIDRYKIATCLIPKKNSRQQAKQQQQQHKNKYRMIECIFAFHPNDHEDHGGCNQKRIRVRVYLKDNCHEFHSSMPIEIIQERKTSEKSTKGCIADGGGLDARTVMELVGKENIHKPFSDEVVVVAAAGGGGENVPPIPSTKTTTTTTTFVLPGNILLRKCNNNNNSNNNNTQQTLELCLVEEEKREDPDMVVLDGHGSMEQPQQQQHPQGAVTRRVVVQYNFQYNDDDDDDDDDDPIVQCFLEKKLGSM